MATDTWTGGSGSWGVASNWSGDNGTPGVPVVTDDVVIDTAGITVTVGSGVAAVCHTLSDTNATLSITGGTLFTVERAIFNGAFIETAGTFTMSGYGANFDQSMTMLGGSMNVLSGAANIYDGGTLAGTISGAGALNLINGTTYIDSGFACTIASIVVGAQGGKLAFNTNFSYGNDFTLLQNGVLDIFGHTLTLTGGSLLEGTVGYGKIVQSGGNAAMTIGNGQNYTVFDNGLILSIGAHAQQDGNLALGANDSGAKLQIGKGGVYDIAGNWNIADPSSIGTITNAGVFAKDGGGKTSAIFSSFTSTGQLEVQIGTVLLEGLVNSVSGTVSGGGTLGIGGGRTTFGANVVLESAALNQISGVLVLNKALSYAGIWDMSGGVLDLNAPKASLTLTGQADFDGGTLSGYGGKLIIDGSANVGNVTIGGPNTISIGGTLDQTNTITFGLSSNPTAVIASGAEWILEGDSDIIGTYGLINNHGTFIDPNGSGNAIVQAEIASNGTITVNNSTLTLAGANSLSGTLSGSGQLDLAGYTVLNNNVTMTVAALTVDGSNLASTTLGGNLTYGGAFGLVQNGVLDLAGHTLTLGGTASLDLGLVTDGGTLVLAGNAFIGNAQLGGTAELLITGTAEQTGNFNLGPGTGPGTVDIAAKAVFTLDDDVSIIENTAAGNLIVAGTFAAGGTGQSFISAALTETGLIAVNDQLLEFGDGGSINGSISGAGTFALGDFGNGAFSIGAGNNIAVADWEVAANGTVTLGANVAYAGQFQELAGGTLALGNETMTLSGTSTLSGLMTGTGTVLDSGSSTLSGAAVISGALLSITGSAEQLTTIQVGEGNSLQTPPSTAELLIASGGAYTLDANASINGNGTLAVAGTLSATGDGTSQIGATIVDTGVIAANLGTLDVLGTVGGSGVFSIGGAGVLEFANTATITASTTISFSAGVADLELFNEASFHAVLAHMVSGSEVELSGFDASTLTGTLNGAGTVMTVTDAHGDSMSLTFSTAQSLSSYTFGTGAHGLAAIIHV